ncbi:MAG: hypothetical protein RLZZ142_1550, partial [Verrucomicrobiota bacterium]
MHPKPAKLRGEGILNRLPSWLRSGLVNRLFGRIFSSAHARRTPLPIACFRELPRFAQAVSVWTVLCLGFAPTPLLAAVVTKENNALSLSSGAAWQGGIAPSGSDTALFDSTITGPLTLDLGADLSILGMRFTQPGGALTLLDPSYRLTLGAGGLDVNAPSQAVTLGSAMTLGAAQLWNVGMTSSVTVSGTISGSESLVKTGMGNLRLTASANSYTGSTQIQSGALTISNSAQLGNSTSTVVVGGFYSSTGFSDGQLVLDGGTAGMTLTRNLSLNGR